MDYFANAFLKAATLGSTPSNKLLVLAKFLGNKYASPMDEEACKLLSLYVAFVRALYLLHQQNHWDSQDYGEHLLFQRLYEEASEIVDDAAERVVGLCGELMLTGTETDIVKKFAPREKSIQSLLESSIALEQAFQQIAKKTYDSLKEKDMITLGLDDLIMAQASTGETHLYLLQQALKGL